MTSLRELPEIVGLEGRQVSVRIPAEIDVPLTPRVKALVDTAEFRRLARISQLGLVSLIYPAAIHTRFEHALGVYRLALLFVRQLSYDERFAATVTRQDAERFIAAALLHDIGHWPFCHPLEDMRLERVPQHEQFAGSFLLEGELGDVLRRDWQIEPQSIVALLSEEPHDAKQRLLASLLSGPIDIDKMDYLGRDSLHAGVPYGRNFDQGRLIGSLCLNAAGDGLALGEKGKTAAEMMVFARYVMFSEVYWHHGVRSATAMLQRAFFLVHEQLDFQAMFRLSEAAWISAMFEVAAGYPAEELLTGLFGPTRRLYKRLAQYTLLDEPEMFGLLARRPYPWLARCAEEFAALASAAIGQTVAPHEILFDAPPVEREVDFDIDVHFAKTGRYRTLGEISPVVRALGTQFDDYVKRVRVFAHPRVVEALRTLAGLHVVVQKAVEQTEVAIGTGR